MGRSAWELLAEALGITTEMNWDTANKQRRMQQNGTMDRRNQQGPMPYFKPQVQRIGGPQQSQSQRQPIGMKANPNAMAQIPAGSDVPGQQPNPLFAVPKPQPRLSNAANSPQALNGGTDESEDEDAEY